MRAHLADAPRGGDCPTGAELVARLLRPVAELPVLRDRIRYRTRVAGIARAACSSTSTSAPHPGGRAVHAAAGHPARRGERRGDPRPRLQRHLRPPEHARGRRHPRARRAVLDHRITRTIPDTADPSRWAGTVLLVGAGKSAQTAARDLAALPGTRLVWAVRNPAPDWGEVPDDTLPARQGLVDASRALAGGGLERVTVHTGARVASLKASQDGRVTAVLDTGAGPREVAADHVVSLTGYTGDPVLHRQLQVHECYATGAPMALSAALLSAGGAGADCLAQRPPASTSCAVRNRTSSCWAPSRTAASTPSCCAAVTSRSTRSPVRTPRGPVPPRGPVRTGSRGRRTGPVRPDAPGRRGARRGGPPYGGTRGAGTVRRHRLPCRVDAWAAPRVEALRGGALRAGPAAGGAASRAADRQAGTAAGTAAPRGTWRRAARRPGSAAGDDPVGARRVEACQFLRRRQPGQQQLPEAGHRVPGQPLLVAPPQHLEADGRGDHGGGHVPAVHAHREAALTGRLGQHLLDELLPLAAQVHLAGAGGVAAEPEAARVTASRRSRCARACEASVSACRAGLTARPPRAPRRTPR